MVRCSTPGGLKKGMTISATKIVEVPETVVSKRTNNTGTMPEAAPQLRRRKRRQPMYQF